MIFRKLFRRRFCCTEDEKEVTANAFKKYGVSENIRDTEKTDDLLLILILRFGSTDEPFDDYSSLISIAIQECDRIGGDVVDVIGDVVLLLLEGPHVEGPPEKMVVGFLERIRPLLSNMAGFLTRIDGSCSTLGYHKRKVATIVGKELGVALRRVFELSQGSLLVSQKTMKLLPKEFKDNTGVKIVVAKDE